MLFTTATESFTDPHWSLAHGRYSFACDVLRGRRRTGWGDAGVLVGPCRIEVAVLEKHADFLRDFRGGHDSPIDLAMMHELGCSRRSFSVRIRKIRELHGMIGDSDITLADFSHLPTQCRFIAMMPQWDFLNFLSEAGGRYPSFHLGMQAKSPI